MLGKICVNNALLQLRSLCNQSHNDSGNTMKALQIVYAKYCLTHAAADIYNSAGVVMLAVAVYAGLYLSIGKPFLPTHGPAWAIVFIWFCALVMGFAVDRVSFGRFHILHGPTN